MALTFWALATLARIAGLSMAWILREQQLAAVRPGDRRQSLTE